MRSVSDVKRVSEGEEVPRGKTERVCETDVYQRCETEFQSDSFIEVRESIIESFKRQSFRDSCDLGHLLSCMLLHYYNCCNSDNNNEAERYMYVASARSIGGTNAYVRVIAPF